MSLQTDETRSPIFHLGYHKTGSTFLQKRLWGNCNNYTYDERRTISDWITEPYSFDFDPEACRNKILNKFGRAFICSSEDLIGNPLSAGGSGFIMEGMVGRIHALFPESTIVIFIREQTSYLQSLYVQYIKSGGTYSLGSMINPHALNPTMNACFRRQYLEYDRVLDTLQRKFPSLEVKVYSYRSLFDGVAFYEQMNQDLDLGLEASQVVDERINVKMSPLAFRLQRFLNHFTKHIFPWKQYWVDIPGFYPIARKVTMHADRIMFARWKQFDENTFWPDHLREELKDYYKESNLRMEQTYGIKF